jgi:hypothetical protein
MAAPKITDRAAAIAALLDGVFDSVELDAIRFPPIRYLVEGYVAEGATLLAGAPKIGKSWMALNIAHAVATGRPVFGSVPTRQGDVLYIALEDNPRRLQRRQTTMGAQPTPHLQFHTRWMMLEEGAIEAMDAWIARSANPVLIVVDVLAKVRAQSRGNDQAYEADYYALSGMQSLASARNIAILIVHHTRKADADDPFDTVSGTRGLTGAADAVLVLRRDFANKRATLYGRGRDIAEIETPMVFEGATGRWRALDAAEAAARSPEREAVIKVLMDAGGKQLSPQQVAEAVGTDSAKARKLLFRMASIGDVQRSGRGLYRWGAGNDGNEGTNGEEKTDLLDLVT